MLVHPEVSLVYPQGSIAAQGTYSELKATGLDFVKLLSDDLEEDALEEQKIFRQRSISVSIYKFLLTLSINSNCECYAW
jgi:hypothetical protein